MLVIACPGQGSQTPGFLVPWLEEFPDLEGVLGTLGQACNADLVKLGTVASEEEIKDTANAQRLIVGSAIGVFRTALNKLEIDGVLGHSVGEFAAAAIAGVISDEDAMTLVGARADAMAAAAAATPTSMAAVLGGDQLEVESALSSYGLEPANYNGPGQIVAAGAKAAIEKLVTEPPSGTRVIELKVAGAFHTSYMELAKDPVSRIAEGLSPSDPQIALWSNVDGKRQSSGSAYLDSLVSQISSPVRWDKCMETLGGNGVKLVELPPAGALTGLAKRGIPDGTAIALKNPADLEKVLNA